LLIRHGLPHENHPRHPGDPPLHPDGLRHAERLALRLQGEGIGAIACSPQRRAQDTAKPLAQLLGIAPVIHEGLAEVDHGTDRYRSVETLQAESPQGFAEFMANPARFFGKDPDQFRQTVLSAFEAVLAQAQSDCTAVYAHGMTIKTILCAVLNVQEAYARLLISHCSVSRLSCSPKGHIRIDSVNESLCQPV
jgi:probable phosphoglycerate mutase